MNKIKVPLLIALGASFLFSILSINFSLDISLLAFPVSALITFFCIQFLYFKILRNKEYKSFIPSLKLLQYLPYVLLLSFILRRAGQNETYYWYDVVTVVLWCTVIVCRWIVLFFFNEKKIFTLMPEWSKEVKKNGSSFIVKPAGSRKIVFEILDWIDALVQAVFMVLLIQIFVFQLYVIPSESMVPSFLVKDRVVVSKITSGPKFPLSDVGVPCLKQYKRGDVIVFRNPHYSLDRKSEVRTVVSQIVYMLTFTGVNLNVDENGEIKADPLVKRICGVPGEQLVMQDGVLYSRTVDSDIFKPVDFDNKYAYWNLNKTTSSVKKGIQYIPLTQKQYDTMLEVEELRRKFNINSAIVECKALSENFMQYCKFSNKSESSFDTSLYEYDLFANNFSITNKIIESKSGYEWYKKFLTDWISSRGDAMKLYSNDIYSEANYKLNLMIKLCVGRILMRNAQLISLGKTTDEIISDSTIAEYMLVAEKLHFYVMILDQRNMPVFPECDSNGNPAYIPENCYFMMGDNRFNSLDMRHSYEQKFKKLTEFDDYSVCYYSNMAPQYVNKKYILGSAIYRFWPLERRGVVKTN